MKKLQFKCTLKSDIILNTKAATEGSQSTLDFIPGSNFLGIVASAYDNFTPVEQLEIFHSGKVRFGDAHPAGSDSVHKSQTIIRSLHVPAALFYPKDHKPPENYYIFHAYSRKKDKEENGQPMQLKQCRNGFYIFGDHTGKHVEPPKSFALKSAYDRELRRSKDEQMYGYESLDANTVFLFEVEVDDDALADKITPHLTGLHRIGRSRTAQYGLAEIETCNFQQVICSTEPQQINEKKYIIIYADSRLIFLDNSGISTFDIEACDLGLQGEIDWKKTQIRTFQYAPWNGKRQARDPDLCGIEKGSVIVVETDQPITKTSAWVGNYRSEGFGKVLYNPEFLAFEKNTNGKASYHLIDLKSNKVANDETKTQDIPLKGTSLLDFLNRKRTEKETDKYICKKVNQFVDKNFKDFKDTTFASQWGNIRSIAMVHSTYKEIEQELFDKPEIKYHKASPTDSFEGNRSINRGYLVHGVAEKSWKKKGRIQKLKDFIQDFDPEKERQGESDYHTREFGDIAQKAVINLASEMAKKCSKNGKGNN